MATYLEYMQAAMNHADYEQMEDGNWFVSIPGLTGLWATGETKEEARKELYVALDGWLHVNAHVGKLPLPKFDGLGLADTTAKGWLNWISARPKYLSQTARNC